MTPTTQSAEEITDAGNTLALIALAAWIATLAALLVIAPTPADFPAYQFGDGPSNYQEASQ